MKIVIIGAGEIGYDLASVLSAEKHDVTVLDRERGPLSRVTESLDVLTKEGNATSVKDLVDTGVSDADILICVTSVDEVNMMSGMIGKRLGAKMVIARVRSEEFSGEEAPLSPSDLGIDVMIHPELSAAQEIAHLLRRSSASDVINLADKKMQLIGIRLEANSPLNGVSLNEYADRFPDIVFRVVAIGRRGRTIIPNGSIKLQKYDQVFILAKTEHIPQVIKTTGKKETELHSVMIAGGSDMGAMIARLLCADQTKNWSIKLIEPDYELAEELAIELKEVMVLNGNPTDPDLLVTEGINEMDAFIAVTDDEESNIISCLMAKHLEVKKTVALVSKPDFIPLAQTIGLDAVINKKVAASNEIHRYVRRGKVISVTELRGIKAEVIELQATPGSKITKKPIKKLRLPDGCVIGGILCNGSVEIVTGASQVDDNDRVIIFCLPTAIDKVTKLFQ
ncbi:Trk system potassium transporter TrkA [Gracilimonas mengyeensis]|uniref:Trk system potassium uptake protein TrkA n=1 Tax=Gracilimonas mengyeensis TaxID=1302730 RepID=A0A521ES22_9BACT|nr:Trk system potassium transporter TrkA [Gracilimonas mengyeensis]SMO86726.1 trk system potassium uptake protein TrkA [Gracilimonas mengyeensis]